MRSFLLALRGLVGARPAAVLRMVVGDGPRLAVPGLGLVAALVSSGSLSPHLSGVGARDPRAFVLVAALFGSPASVACVLPARRATRVDPMEVLRDE